MKQSVVVFALLCLLGGIATAGTGDGNWYYQGEEIIVAGSVPCTKDVTATTGKQVVVCPAAASNRGGFSFRAPFPHMATAVNTFKVKITASVNSTDTSKQFGYRCKYVVTTAGGDWDANDGTLSGATFTAFATSSVIGTANRDIDVTTAVITAYDQQQAADCASVAACKDKHALVYCERGNNSDVSNNINASVNASQATFIYDTP